MVGRRTVLLGAAAITAALALDLTHDDHRSTPPATPTPPAPDPLLAAATADEQALIEAYEGALRAHPALSAALALPLAHHRVHLAALGSAAEAAAGHGSAGRGPAVGRAASPPLSVPSTVPATAPVPTADAAEAAAQRATLAALRSRELAAAGARSAAAVADLPHGGLLASVAAAEAVHADLLAPLRVPTPPAGRPRAPGPVSSPA